MCSRKKTREIISICNLVSYFTEYIPTISSDTPAAVIDRKYLQRNRPVVITNDVSQSPINEISIFLQTLLSIDGKLDGGGICNMKSNRRSKNSQTLSQIIASFDAENGDEEQDGFFLHFRNCEFESVKESRQFWRRPNYLHLHLNPFYSSWILMSKRYAFKRFKFVDVQGMILVNQITGSVKVELRPRKPCDEECMDLEIELHANEALIFVTDLWQFFYSPLDRDDGTAITFIAEFDYK